MNKKISILTICLCIISIGLSIAALAVALPALKKADKPQTDIQYVLYLGTNDKDTNTPVFTHEEAQEQLKEILLDKFGGYTIQEAFGGWKDDGVVYNEYTLVIYLSDTTIDDVHAAADEMIRVFNQSSVLIQCNQTTTEFYSGNN